MKCSNLAAPALLCLALGASPQAFAQRICVFDILGAQGDIYSLMKDYQLAANNFGASLELKPYTDEKIAAEDFTTQVPERDRRDEIGEMARALEVFRTNEEQMRAMEAQEAALHAQSRDLQTSISGIVAAAAAGDFSKRISKTYEDADLQRFAASVNELVESVDRGITEVIVTKHRNGPVGTVKLLFEPQFTRFRNLAAPSGF